MKTLIAYYSRTGTNEALAKALQERLGCDIERIIDKRDREGKIGYIFAGRDAMQKRKTELGPLKKDPADYNMVIIATPVWAWSVPPAIRTYISENREKFKEIALLSVSGDGPGNKGVVPCFEELAGKKAAAVLMLKERYVKEGIAKMIIEGFAREISRQ